uniref:Periplasmic protein n=1 Tax=mine drainage metagenome TaxID=410659 RepID=E6QUC2_9ZZZZ
MNFLKPALIMAFAFLFAISLAQAGPTNTASPSVTPSAPCDAHAGKHMMMDQVTMAQKRMEHLKSSLNITPDQEPVWQVYADKVAAQIKSMANDHEHMYHEDFDKSMTTPERIEKMAANMKARAQDMSNMAVSTKNLYDKLTPEQRATFDTISAHEAETSHTIMQRDMCHHIEHARMNRSPATPGNTIPTGQ